MGFEVLKAFQVETRRFLWLVGLVFATILLFQGIELPKGTALWSVFSRGKDPEQNVPSFFGENSTSNPVMLSNLSAPSAVNTSILAGKEKNSSVRVDAEGRKSPNVSLVSKNNTEAQKEDLFAFPPEQSEDLDLVWIAPSPTVASNLSIESSTTLSPNRSTDSNPTSANNDFPSPLAPTVASNLSIESILTSSPHISTKSNTTSVNNDLPPPLAPVVYSSAKKPKIETSGKEVYTLTDMNELLIESYLSPTMMPRWPSKADEELVLAKQLIENAPPLKDGLYAPLYRNASMFQRSYEVMEQMLKVYIYREGDRRIFHRPPLEGLYASEGWFMKMMEADKHFVTKQPKEAHLFYLPFSSRQLEETLYVPNSHNHKNLIQYLKDYVDLISMKYPFWNRTDGADHFLVACHDWAPSETNRIRMSNCIRALCNADVKENFNFGKDVSLPETYVRKARNPLRDIGGKPLSKRKTLAFYAGSMHGYLRPILLQHWGNKNDPDMQIFGKLPQTKDNRNYINYMKSSKYCICPRGYEVNSPRVVEAIFYECVPVIISDNFVPPFFETLNWESFAVFVAEKDIPDLKNILQSIPKKTYLRMQMRIRKVQQHFLWHPQPVKYDLYHMILHSVWSNRVFQVRP